MDDCVSIENSWFSMVVCQLDINRSYKASSQWLQWREMCGHGRFISGFSMEGCISCPFFIYTPIEIHFHGCYNTPKHHGWCKSRFYCRYKKQKFNSISLTCIKPILIRFIATISSNKFLVCEYSRYISHTL